MFLVLVCFRCFWCFCALGVRRVFGVVVLLMFLPKLEAFLNSKP